MEEERSASYSQSRNNNNNMMPASASSSSSSIHSPISLTSPLRRFSSPTSQSIFYGDRFIPSRISSQLDSGLISITTPDTNIENENPINSLIRSELLGHSTEMAQGNRSQNSSSSVLRYQSSIDDIQRYTSHVAQASSPANSTTSNSPYRATSMPTIGSPNRVSSSFDPSSTSLGGSARKPKRKISRVPYKVLDAPSLQDDFYLNLVDWSKNNVLAVALGTSVYLWSAYTSKVVKLHDFSVAESDILPGASVTSVCWMNGGTHIAVGTSSGRIQVWDAATSVKVRELHPHAGRVGSLSWNQQYCLVASGSKDKNIFLQDSRIHGIFTPSRHLNTCTSKSPPPTYPTPQRPHHPIHSNSPDLRPHHPILSSRPLSTQSSPITYSSPQRLLASMKRHQEDGNDDDGEDDGVKEEGKDKKDYKYGGDEDEEDFSMRFLRSSPTERSSRRRQTLSPTSHGRSLKGIPPRPPSLPGTAEKMRIRREYKLKDSRRSESVLGHEQEDGDDFEMRQVSDDEEEDGEMRDERNKRGGDSGTHLKALLETDRNESPVLRLYGELEEQRNVSNSERAPQSNSAARKLEFMDNPDGDGDDDDDTKNDDANFTVAQESEPYHFLEDDHIPSRLNLTPPRSNPPSHLRDYTSQPTYLPQYGSPTSSTIFSPYPQMDVVQNSSSSSSSASPLPCAPSVVHELCSHKQEVCGLKWSFDEKQLASGGNDNKLFIWNIAGLSYNERSQQKRESSGHHRNQILVPEHEFVDHTAAVKAIAWSPHQQGLLVSGGGTADRQMRFWNTQTGLALQSLDTGSQVCNLMWSTYSNELVSTHGYSLNQIAIWKYPSLQKLATLTGHTYRVLFLAMSPNGQSIVTGAGDETLRFWNVFPGSKSSFSTGKGMLLHVGGEIR